MSSIFLQSGADAMDSQFFVSNQTLRDLRECQFENFGKLLTIFITNQESNMRDSEGQLTQQT